MKKGISLIVLVITIIVMIIIAGAIIISLNSTNILAKSNEAVVASNKANARSLLNLKYSEILAVHYAADPTVKYVPSDKVDTDGDGTTDLAELKAAIEALTDKNEGWTVVLTEDGKYDIAEKE